MSHDGSRIVLPERGVVLVTGPNGAGKSAVAEGIAQAMWGKSLRGTRWSPWRAEKAGSVEIEDGGLHIHRRWTGKSKSLTWSKATDVEFDTTTKAQESLDTVVGPFEVWRRTCVFSAADAAHFTQSSDSERKELLEQLLGLGWFDRALDACRQDLRVAHGSLNVTEHERSQAVAKADGLAVGLSEGQKMLADMPPAPEVGLARAELARIDAMLSAANADLQDAGQRRSKLLSVGGRDDERVRQVRTKLEKLGDHCYACGQEISKALHASMMTEIEQAGRAAEYARSCAAEDLRKTSAEAEELAEEAEALRRMVSTMRQKIAAADATRTARANLERSLRDSGAQVAQLAEKILASGQKVERLRVEVAELTACETVLGVRGARAHIVGETLGSIEAVANEWMRRLSSRIEIQLKPYTEKKSGGVVDSISLALRGAGGDGGYVGASAGERRRVDVALLLALSELASGSVAGASWRSPIFFDEVFDSLDADGREAVRELVDGIAAERCVVLITHDEHVASARADVRIHVDKGVVT